MADNDDTTPARAASNGHAGATRSAASKARSTAASARRRVQEISEDLEDAVSGDVGTLEDQVSQLRSDIRSIASTLTNIGQSGANELKSQGQSALDYAQDEFGALEKQIKDTIREKPLTAVAGALAAGFILAVITR